MGFGGVFIWERSTSVLTLLWSSSIVKVLCSNGIAISVYQALKTLKLCKSHKAYNCLF